MPFDDFLDISLELTDEDIQKIDAAAAKAEKKLEAAKRKLERQGGIFGSDTGQALPKSIEKAQADALLSRGKDAAAIQKEKGPKLKSGVAPIVRTSVIDDIKNEQNMFRTLLSQQVGVGKASQAMGFLQNVQGSLLGLAKAAPFIAALLESEKIIKAIITELTKKGALFDQFFSDIVDGRLDLFRQKDISQKLAIGEQQLIISTSDGNTNPRDSFNSYSLVEEDRRQAENDFSIRSTGGFD